MILPTSRYKIFWNLILVFLLLYVATFLPYRTAFLEEVPAGVTVMEYIIDFLFTCDILVNFLSAYYDEDNSIVTDSCAIAKKYLKTWFLIDLLAWYSLTNRSFPFQVFESGTE